ncbi:DUF3558 domain-containing protein [Actinokineospora sp. HUAS TT18]|uniref:DUF3558 domain-containing protein n=1 Tax=Actinokineospora sp. HUAS TT18 TaxID=3447451 RepID=UPI003F523D4F
MSAVVLLAAAACTTNEPGTATSTDVPTSGSDSPTTSSSAGSLPPRPKEIKLDAIDPCAVLTKPQSDSLKVDKAKAGTSTSETYPGAKECVFSVFRQAPYYDYAVLLVTSEGVDSWFTTKRNVDVKEATVEGFGAARFHIRGGSGTKGFECTTAVDVAQGQQLQVGVYLNSRGAFTQDQICQMSEEAAAMAVTTLKTLG